MLTVTQQVSFCFGWLGFGFGFWSYIPTLIFNARHTPEKGGMNWYLLGIWLAGDVCSLIYYLMSGGGQPNQYISVGWFALGDVTIILQQLLYQGHMPKWCCCFDPDYRKNRQDRHTARALKGHRGLRIALGAAHRSPNQNYVYSVGHSKKYAAHSSRKQRHVRRQRRRRQHDSDSDVELALPKWSKKKKKTRADEQDEEDEEDDDRSCCTRLGDFAESKPGQGVMIVGILVAMLIIFFVEDYLKRDTLTIEDLKPPKGAFEIGIWSLGWVGWLLYNGPRLLQIKDIYDAKTTDGLSIPTFLLLGLQNVANTIQVWLVSPSWDYRFRTAPAFASAMAPLLLDGPFNIIGFHLAWGNAKSLPVEKRPWTAVWGLPLTPRAYRKMFNIPSIPLHRKIVNYIRRKPNDERGPPLASENTVRGNGAVEPLGGVILSHGFPEGTSKEGKLDAEQISENRDADWERRERERIAKDEKRQKKVAELDKIQGAVPRSKRHQWREEQLRDYPIGSPGQVDGRAVEGIDARRARWEKMKLARADAIRIHEHPWLTEEARDAAWEQHRLTFFAGDETNPEEEREEAAGRSKRAAGDKKEAAGRGTTEKARLLGKGRRPEEVEGGGVRLGTLPSRDGRGRPPQVERQASLAKGGRGRRERYTDSSSSESSSGEEAW